MALVHVRIFGKSIDDSLVFKIILGSIFFLILLLLIGVESTGDWVLKSMLLQTAVILLVLPLTIFFIEESLAWRHIGMLAVGITIIIGYGLYSSIPALTLAVIIIQSIIWMTVFSALFTWSTHLK